MIKEINDAQFATKFISITRSYSASVITVEKSQEIQNPHKLPHITHFHIYVLKCLRVMCQKVDWRDCMDMVLPVIISHSIISFLIIPRNDSCGDDTVRPNYSHLPCINHKQIFLWLYNIQFRMHCIILSHSKIIKLGRGGVLGQGEGSG